MKTLKVSQAIPALLITYVIALISLAIPMFTMDYHSFETTWMSSALNSLVLPLIALLVIGIIICPIIMQRMYEFYPQKSSPGDAPRALLGFMKCVMQIPAGGYILIAFNMYIADIIPSGPWNFLSGLLVGYIYAKVMLQVIKLVKPLSKFLDKMVTDQL